MKVDNSTCWLYQMHSTWLRHQQSIWHGDCGDNGVALVTPPSLTAIIIDYYVLLHAAPFLFYKHHTMVSQPFIAVKPDVDNLPIVVIRVTVYCQHTAGTAYVAGFPLAIFTDILCSARKVHRYRTC